MRNASLAISTTFMLLAIVILPGVGFCLESSITSYDNPITIIGSTSDFNGMTVDINSKNAGYGLSDKGTDSGGREYCELTNSNNTGGAFSDDMSGSSATIEVEKDVGFWIRVDYGKNSTFSLSLKIGNSMYGTYEYNKSGKSGTIYLGKPQQTGDTLSLITNFNKNNSILDQHQEITITVTGYNPPGQAPIRIYFIFDSDRI